MEALWHSDPVRSSAIGLLGIDTMIEVRGILKDGRVTLLEPVEISGEVPVVVTVLSDDQEWEAAELKAKSESLRNIWDDPQLDIYNEA